MPQLRLKIINMGGESTQWELVSCDAYSGYRWVCVRILTLHFPNGDFKFASFSY